MVTVVMFGMGILVGGPGMYFDPDTPMWLVPCAIGASGIPLVAVALLSAPFVCAVRIALPVTARRNHEALMRFAENVPQDTRVLIQTMRWVPWPTHKEMFFGDLRRLPETRLSANLEHVPLGHEKKQKASQFMGRYLATRMYERYYVNMTVKNRSRAPGVWEKMWEQITIKGREPVKVPPKERLPPAMANRAVPSGGAGRKLPPPPPAKGGAKSKRSR